MGVGKDFEEAAAWFRRAAEQGHAISQYNLGVMNKNGFGVAQDVAEAAQWMRRAARQGNAGAQYILGAMYSTGQGVDEDPVRAHMWLDLAARSGDERAGATLDRLAKSMTREQVGEARQLVGEWKPNTE